MLLFNQKKEFSTNLSPEKVDYFRIVFKVWGKLR